MLASDILIDAEISAYLPGQAVVDLAVAWNRGTDATSGIDEDRMASALTMQLAAIRHQVSYELPPLHRCLTSVPDLAEYASPATRAVQLAIGGAHKTDRLTEVLLDVGERGALRVGSGELQHIADVAFGHLLEYCGPFHTSMKTRNIVRVKTGLDSPK